MSKDFLRKLGLRELSIGDTVYYISPSSRYAVKRSQNRHKDEYFGWQYWLIANIA